MNIEICDDFIYRVEQGDDLFSICKKFNTCKENILRNNYEIPFYCGEFIKIKINDFVLHVVKPMETLEKISQIHGVTTEKIKQDNNIENDRLFIGQIVKICK